MDSNFEDLYEKAAQVHGHKCPSLFYGVSFGLLAKNKISSDTKVIILEGSSKCIRDGITTALQELGLRDKLLLLSNPPACALTLGNNNIQRFILSSLVRQTINQWHKELPLEEFQIKGVAYLRTLKSDELFKQEAISNEQFEKLMCLEQKNV